MPCSGSARSVASALYATRRCQMCFPTLYGALHGNVRQSIYTRSNLDVMLKFKANAGYGTVKSVMNLGFRKGGEVIDRTFSGRTRLLSLFRLYTFLSVRSLLPVKPSPERGRGLHVLWYLAQSWIYRLKFMFIMSRYTVLKERKVSLPFDVRNWALLLICLVTTGYYVEV